MKIDHNKPKGKHGVTPKRNNANHKENKIKNPKLKTNEIILCG